MTTHIRLELRPEGDGFAGRATSDEASHEFHGWLGLVGAIDALYPARQVSENADAALYPARPDSHRKRSRTHQ